MCIQRLASHLGEKGAVVTWAPRAPGAGLAPRTGAEVRLSEEPGLPDVAEATLPSLFIANWTVALLGGTELIFYVPTPQQGLP